MDISTIQPKSDIHTWIYPWIYPWISTSTATLPIVAAAGHEDDRSRRREVTSATG